MISRWTKKLDQHAPVSEMKKGILIRTVIAFWDLNFKAQLPQANVG